MLVLEELNVAGMVRNRHLAESISEAAMGELARQILCKARSRGVEVRMADRFFPSSKTCSGSGAVKSELSLSQRSYSCGSCDLTIDRDLNAAINLARRSSNVPTPIAPSDQSRSAFLYSLIP